MVGLMFVGVVVVMDVFWFWLLKYLGEMYLFI